jgi:dihydroorotate dehydrogenase electron transfer subunit
MKDVSAKIVENEAVADGVNRLRLKGGFENYTPGQFVMISVPDANVFLRRPFSICSLRRGVLEIYFKIVGKATSALAGLGVGAKLNVLGPCGRGFDTSRLSPAHTTVLVAGGYGVAPLFGLACEIRHSKSDIVLFYGAKSSGDLFLVNEFKKLGAKVYVSTEDGSRGEKGLVTKMLEKKLGGIKSPSMFSCGPRGLLSEVAKICKAGKIAGQISAEEYMACGIGVCLGCCLKDAKGEFVRACKDGPVFDVREVL